PAGLVAFTEKSAGRWSFGVGRLNISTWLPPGSATYIRPEGRSRAIPQGKTRPDPAPAAVPLKLPSGPYCWIRPAKVSVAYTFPPPSTVTPKVWPSVAPPPKVARWAPPGENLRTPEVASVA